MTIYGGPAADHDSVSVSKNPNPTAVDQSRHDDYGVLSIRVIYRSPLPPSGAARCEARAIQAVLSEGALLAS
jgi:hypothetical protein